MTKTQREAHKNEIISLIKGFGYMAGRYPDKYMKEKDGATYRYDLSGISVRYDKKIIIPASMYCKEEVKWIGLWAAYYKDIRIEDGKLILPSRDKRLV